jgi:hypothetical protein
VVDSFGQALPDPEPSQLASSPFLQRFEFHLLDAQLRYGLDVNRIAWSNRGYAAFASLNVPIFDWFRSSNASKQFSARAAQVTEDRAIAERRFSLKKVGRFWSVRVGLLYRAIGVQVPDGVLWAWVGSHAEYDERIG